MEWVTVAREDVLVRGVRIELTREQRSAAN
jgi:hypothetical protein